jgi:hypothetical protein
MIANRHGFKNQNEAMTKTRKRQRGGVHTHTSASADTKTEAIKRAFLYSAFPHAGSPRHRASVETLTDISTV